MIGNDIVDLEVAAMESNWKRPGFLQKLFQKFEQESINTTSNPSRMVWTLWAMKEAAYKAHYRRYNLSRRFNPLQFHCSFSKVEKSFASGNVEIGESRYVTKTEFGENYLHCIAVSSGEIKHFSRILPAKVTLKEKLIKDLSHIKDLSAEKMSIKKNSYKIPYFTYDEKVLNYPFSLSHHGKFAAYTVALMNY